MSGKKYDEGKPRMDLIEYTSIAEIAKVMGYGADKYTAYNWKGGIAQSRLYAAALRHLGQYWSGEDTDPETGISHVAHAGCNIMMLLWMIKNRPDLDDRYIPEVKLEAVEEKKSETYSYYGGGEITFHDAVYPYKQDEYSSEVVDEGYGEIRKSSIGVAGEKY